MNSMAPTSKGGAMGGEEEAQVEGISHVAELTRTWRRQCWSVGDERRGPELAAAARVKRES